MPEERRKYPRSKPDPVLRIFCATAEFEEKPLHRTNLALKWLDVSAKGSCIVTSGRLRVGVQLMVTIDVPDTTVRFRAKAAVRWSQSLQHKGREAEVAGIEFMEVLEAQGEKVQFLRSWWRGPLEGEIRKHKRVAFEGAKVECLPSGLWSALGLSSNAARSLTDVSEGGCQFVASRKLEPGSRVKVRISFKHPSVTVQAEGEVRWCNRDTNSLEPRYATGIEFRDISREDEARLRVALGPSGEAGARPTAR
jgi:c-di-GMP-binding flagellar brake protein YcgR